MGNGLLLRVILKDLTSSPVRRKEAPWGRGDRSPDPALLGCSHPQPSPGRLWTPCRQPATDTPRHRRSLGGDVGPRLYWGSRRLKQQRGQCAGHTDFSTLPLSLMCPLTPRSGPQRRLTGVHSRCGGRGGPSTTCGWPALEGQPSSVRVTSSVCSQAPGQRRRKGHLP